MPSAPATNSASASAVSMPSRVASVSRDSMYRRMVAPSVPVPDRRNTMRAPSSKSTRIPWFALTLPSTGSVYAKSSALVTRRDATIVPGNVANCARRCAITPLAASVGTPS